MTANRKRIPVRMGRDDAEIKRLIASQRGWIDFDEVRLLVDGRMDEILDALGADYRQRNNELEVINPNRADMNYGSFSYNVQNSKWGEFAWDDVGGDAIGFVAYYCEIERLDAAKLILAILQPDAKELEEAHRKLTAQNDGQWVRDAVAKAESTQITPVPSDAPPMPIHFFQLGTPSHTYIYRDEDGTPMGAVLRFDTADGKQIRPLTLHEVDNGYAWKMKAFDPLRPMYNLDQIAGRPDAPVMVGEGEKAADALAHLFPNHVATTTSGGANGVRHADLSPLFGRTVYIWPDNDEPGQQYATSIASMVRDVAPETQVFILRQLTVRPAEGNNGQLVDGFTPDKGYDAADALADGWTPAQAATLLAEGHFVLQEVDAADALIIDCESAAQPATQKQYIKTPGDLYMLKDEGVHLVKFKDGEETHVWIASWLRVRCAARNESDTGWGVIVDYLRPDGVYAFVYLSSRELMSSTGDGGLMLLADLGVHISSLAAARTALANYLKSSPKGENLTYTTSKTGWVERCAFMAGDRLIGYPEHQWVYTGSQRAASAFGTSGDLEAWQTKVASRCAGNSRLALAVCVALAGPVQKILGAENGGIHLRGSSSIGKSVALAVAGSVWSPASALKTWRTTDNALEATAMAHNDIVLPLDEMSQASPHVVGEAAYMLGNGQGKARSSVGGGVRQMEKFRCQIVSTGEVNLESHMRVAGLRSMAGQEVRFLDIPADAGAGLGLFECLHGFGGAGLLAETLREQAGTNYGHAGLRMVEALCHDIHHDEPGLLESLQGFVATFVNRHLKPTDSSQVRRVANRFGLFAAAGEYAIKIGLLPWPEGEALRCASVCYQAWLQERGGSESREKIRLKQQVRHFLETHGTSRFERLDWQYGDHGRPRIVNQAGFVDTDDDGQVFYVFPGVFKEEMCAGFDATQAGKWLADDGWIRRDSQGKATVPKSLAGERKQRVYCFTYKALSDEPADAGPQQLELPLQQPNPYLKKFDL